MAEDFTARFRVDISDLKSGLTAARKEITQTNNTFKAETAGMDNWRKDADGLRAKLQQLDGVLTQQKSILINYQEQLKRQEEAYKQNGQRADQLRAKLAELASQGVSKTSAEYKKYEDALKKVESEQERNEKSIQQLNDKITAQKTTILATENETKKWTRHLNDLETEEKDTASAAEQMNDATHRMNDGFTVMKGVVSNLISQGLRKLGQELKSLVTDGAAYADEIATLAKTTRLSTDTLQEMNYISGLVDVSLDTTAGAMKKLTKSMGSAQGGTGAAAEAFADLGVSITDANGNLRKSEDVFFDVISALGGIENETERDTKSMSIFGKSAMDLNPLIEAGGDALADWAEEARAMGYVMDEETIDGLAKVQDEFDRFNNQVTTIKNTIAAALAPALERAGQKLREFIAGIDWDGFGRIAGRALDKIIDGFEWIISHGKTVKTIIGGIIAAMVVSKIAAFVSGLGSLITSLKTIITTLKALWATMASNPYMLLIGAIVAAGAALLAWQKSLQDSAKAADVNWQRTNQLVDGLNAAGESAQQAADAYKSYNDTLTESANAGIAQADHLAQLKTELESLADANGQVADSDKARAQFILNELNGALGTEYTMTGNVIDQYSELTGSLDEVINKKRAMLILEAEESAYQQAIIGKSDAELKLMQLEQQRLPIEQELATLQQRQNEILAMSGPEMAAHASELGDISQRMIELNGSLQANQDEYTATAAAVDGYAWDIQQYTNNAAAAINGDYDSIAHKSYETAVATGEASNAASQEVIGNARAAEYGWLGSLNSMVSEATGKQVEFRDAGNGMVQAYVDGEKAGEALPATQVASMNKQIMWNMQRMEQEMAASGGNAVSGLVRGVDANSWQASSAGSRLANALLSAFRAKAGEGSPWKTMIASGKFAVEGLTQGIKKNEHDAKKSGASLADSFLGGFNNAMDMNGTIDGIRGNTLTNGLTGLAGAIAGAGGGVINNYNQTINTPKAPSRYDLYVQTRNLLTFYGRA